LANWYTTREAFKRALAIQDVTRDATIDRYIEAVNTHSPYRNQGTDQPD